MTNVRRFLPGIFLFAAASTSAFGQAPSVPTPAPRVAPAYESDPKYIAALADAKRLVRQRQLSFARDAYAKANKIAGGECSICIEQMAHLDAAEHRWKDAIAEAEHLKAIAANPRDKSIAESTLGGILIAQAGDKPKPAQLDAAHAAFQAALTDFPETMAHAGAMDAFWLEWARTTKPGSSSPPVRNSPPRQIPCVCARCTLPKTPAYRSTRWLRHLR